MRLIATTALAVLLACPAWAQNCAPRDDVTKKLSESYNESLVARGLQMRRGEQSVMEIWAAEGGGYTVLITHANGLSCIVAVGTDFAVMPKKDGDPA